MNEEEFRQALLWALQDGVHAYVHKGKVSFTAFDGCCESDIEPPAELREKLEEFVVDEGLVL